jgi:hypothetical protein
VGDVGCMGKIRSNIHIGQKSSRESLEGTGVDENLILKLLGEIRIKQPRIRHSTAYIILEMLRLLSIDFQKEVVYCERTANDTV